MGNLTTENTSGQGANAVVPPEIRGWNWGAFLLTWIWGIGNNVLIALLAFVPLFGLVMVFVLGAKGNEWAWQQKRWDNVEHFRRVQRSWAKWGLVVVLASIVLMVVACALLFVVVFAALKSSQPYRDAVDRLQANQQAVAELGAPVTGGIPMGSIQTRNHHGDVNLVISVKGSAKSGVLYVEGEESNGQWQYSRIELVVDGDHIDLNDAAKSDQ